MGPNILSFEKSVANGGGRRPSEASQDSIIGRLSPSATHYWVPKRFSGSASVYIYICVCVCVCVCVCGVCVWYVVYIYVGICKYIVRPRLWFVAKLYS